MNITTSEYKSNLDILKKWGYSAHKTCLVVGTLPPPAGGVSTHISRLLPLLDKASISYQIHDPSVKKRRGFNFWGLLSKIISHRFDQIHIHTLSTQLLYAIFIARSLFQFEIFLYAHNPIFFEDKSVFFNKALNRLLYKVSQINAVSELAKKAIIVKRPHLEQKIFVKSSFLPPDLSKLKQIKQSYPSSLKKFLTQHKPVLILNAYRFHFKEGIDVYGLDLSINLLIRLAKIYPKIGMILALGRRDASPNYLDLQVDKLKDHNLSPNFYILDGFQDIWALFDDCDLMIRPTLYDGFGISVSESILMGTKVLASDLPNRQKECFLFENRNIDDLEKISLEILENLI